MKTTFQKTDRELIKEVRELDERGSDIPKEYTVSLSSRLAKKHDEVKDLKLNSNQRMNKREKRFLLELTTFLKKWNAEIAIMTSIGCPCITIDVPGNPDQEDYVTFAPAVISNSDDWRIGPHTKDFMRIDVMEPDDYEPIKRGPRPLSFEEEMELDIEDEE